MLKTELAPGIVHYMFPPSKIENYYGYNIVAVIHEDKAILIDAAFEEEARQVSEDLSANGITIDKIIISHFHDDHMEGLKVLPKVPVYGSSRFQETLDLWTEKNEHQYFVPTVSIEKPTTIEFGRHTLEIIPSPGHSVCTVLININGQFLHVADEIILSNDGRPILPSIESRDNIKQQLESWSKIERYYSFTILPGHGPALEGDALHTDMQNRRAFAEAILAAGNGPITYGEAVKDCNCTFLHSNWFDHLAEGVKNGNN
ncbi:MAG: MBL fold metallo-hydrolase [Defluviitaleaceae bacterium]|nr:MBL fold metallo-hydrolase [Defluviitaleaceae bacterium]